MTLTLALPSKGALYEGTLATFAECGLAIQREGRGRGYWGAIRHLDGLRVQFLRAEEIPLRVDTGDALLGVSGLDLHREHCGSSTTSLPLIRSLGYGYARLVVAVPDVWIDVVDANDLGEVAARLKRDHARALRVGTKFPRLTRSFFRSKSIRDYVIVDSRGATEGMPASGAADVIVDLTSTGSTLLENGLKEIVDGTAVESEACLLVNTEPTAWSQDALQILRQIIECIEAGTRAKKRRLIHFTIHRKEAGDITRYLASQYDCEIGWEPTVTIGDSDGTLGIPVWTGVVCPTHNVYPVVRYLRTNGATSLSVVKPQLMFAQSSDAMEGFQQLLRRHESKPVDETD